MVLDLGTEPGVQLLRVTSKSSPIQIRKPRFLPFARRPEEVEERTLETKEVD